MVSAGKRSIPLTGFDCVFSREENKPSTELMKLAF